LRVNRKRFPRILKENNMASGPNKIKQNTIAAGIVAKSTECAGGAGVD